MQNFASYLLRLSLVLTILCGPVHAQSPDETLSPSSPWQVNYDDYDCKLSREFGTDETHQLQFMSIGPLNRFSLVLITSELHFVNRLAPITVRTLPQNSTFETRGIVGYLRDDSRYLLKIPSLPISLLEEFEDHQIFEISVGERFSRRFEAGHFRAAISEWQACQYSLLNSWGFDPDEQRNLERAPTPVDTWNWIQPDDYSRDMVDEMERDALVVRLDLDDRGIVRNCSIVQSSGVDAVDHITCRNLLERGQFEPALSAEGQPTEISIPFVVGWIPEQ